MSLIVAGIEIPFSAGAGLDIKQTYQPFGPRKIMRSRSGVGRMASRWGKLKSTISGNCWLPAGIDGISRTAAVTLSCVAPLCIAESDSSIVLPHAYRNDGDYAPQGFALVNGVAITTAVSMAGQVCALDLVSGASQYQISYCPILTGFVSVSRAYDESTGIGSWTIEFEEQ